MSRILIAGNTVLASPESQLFLKAKGFQPLHTTSLPDAVALILEDPPDLLITEKGFDRGGHDLELIRTAKTCLQKANIPILLVLSHEELAAGIDWERYTVDDFILKPLSPEVLLAHIQLAEARMARVFDNNPLTRLPGNTSIIRAIQRTIDSDDTYGVCYIDLDNFKPYNDRYGFSRGDEVLLMVARITVNVVEELARDDSFVGHVGGDDFVFIVRQEKIEPVCRRILDNFERVRNMFLSPDDIKAGCFRAKNRQGDDVSFPLLSLSIAVITTGNKRYQHYGEVSVAASQVKHYVKKLEGNNFMIDRRDR